MFLFHCSIWLQRTSTKQLCVHAQTMCTRLPQFFYRNCLGTRQGNTATCTFMHNVHGFLLPRNAYLHSAFLFWRTKINEGKFGKMHVFIKIWVVSRSGEKKKEWEVVAREWDRKGKDSVFHNMPSLTSSTHTWVPVLHPSCLINSFQSDVRRWQHVQNLYLHFNIHKWVHRKIYLFTRHWSTKPDKVHVHGDHWCLTTVFVSTLDHQMNVVH